MPVNAHMHVLRGLVQLPSDSELITDADEEVFLLYTNLQAVPIERHGLGHVDSRKDTLSIKFELQPPILQSDFSLKKRRKQPIEETIIEVELAQDKTALRSRKGDTGSVLWRATIEFAQLLLQQHHACQDDSLLDRSRLARAHILELGAGTGLLSIVLSPLVCHYTVTDIPALLPLIHKNLTLNFPSWPANSNISLEELDWHHLHRTSHSMRPRVFSSFSSQPIDLILLVDCIYHPSLLPSLLSTIDYLAVPGMTAVLVVVELRAEDVVREWIGIWIACPGWEVRRLGAAGGLKMPYVAWVGWKT